MKKARKLVAIVIPSLFLCAASASAETMGTSMSTGGATSSWSAEDIYDQLISISAGTFTPRSAVISNGTYSFDYGSGTTSTFLVETGWGIRLYKGFYLQENIAYSRFSGNTSSVNTSGGVPDSSLSVNLIGIDTRAAYEVDRFPVRWIIPFIEGGFQYTFYSQTGSSDLDSVQGGTVNFVGGAGVRLWVNRSASLNTDLKGTYSTIPVFVTVKWNSIFPNGSALDLANSGLQAGVSVGL